MRKILSLLLVLLMALSFVPLRNTKTVTAYDKTKATMVGNALQAVQQLATPPNTWELVNSTVTVQRYFQFYWDPGIGLTPLLATDMYLTVISEGSLSKLDARYYVVITENPQGGWFVFIDPDTHFDFPYNLGGPSYSNTRRFLLGDYHTLRYGGAKGRTFHSGWTDMGNNGALDAGDLFLFLEVLKASCCGNEVIYDISIESDVEPVIWPNPLSENPKATAVLGPGTGSDFAPKTQELARSTAYKVSTTTFFDIKLTNREYLDLEIFKDDGVNNNAGGGACVKDNLLDDYVPLSSGEEFIGAVNNDGLIGVANAIGYIVDALSGNKVYVYDNDGSVTFTAGDIILTPTRAGWFMATDTVSAGDVNLNQPLAVVYAAGTVGSITLQGVDFYGPMNTWNTQNPVYGITMTYGDFRGMDIEVLPGEMDLDVKVETEAGVTVEELKVEQTYTVWVSLPEGCTLPAGAKVHVVLELPGYDVNGNPGYEVVKYFTLDNNHRVEKTHNITPWRGSLFADFSTHFEPMFRVRAFAEICTALGPSDGLYDTLYVPELDNDIMNDGQEARLDTNGMTLDPLAEDITSVVPFEYYVDGAKFGNYDCWVYKTYPIIPEELKLTANKLCISPLDQRWPNIGFSVYNVDNPADVDDPSGLIESTDQYPFSGFVNAKGTGIEWLNIATISGTDRYIIQYNSDLSIYVWTWNDDGDLVYERGEVDTQPVYYGPPWKWVDDEGTPTWPYDDNGIPSPGDTLVGTTTYELLSWALPSAIENDGMIYALVRAPVSGCSDIEFTVWLNNVLYNYVGPQPPYYLPDSDFDLIDYLGKVKVTVNKLYDLNFAEFEIVDLALRGSPFSNPYPPYGPATNQWPWVLRNYTMELRSYPGGQTNLPGSGLGYDYQGLPLSGPIDALGVVGLTNGFNARHAQFREIFWKLGTEYYPLTNYMIRFIAKDKYGNHVVPDTIVVEGIPSTPNRTQPVFVVGPYNGVYTYNTTTGLPKSYKYANKWTITSYSDSWLDYDAGLPGAYLFSGYPYDEGDPIELNDVIVLQGIIPVGPGMIKITMYDELGNAYSFKWCTSCFDTPEGVPSHAIELIPDTSSFVVDSDTTLNVEAKVYPFDEKNSPWGETSITTKQPLANQVIMFVWQDRGVMDPVSSIRYGVGDGWITGQTPKFGGQPIDLLLASGFNAGPVYNGYDWNKDGLISFKDLETEIVGTYDVATGAWNGGFVTYTAFTNHINDGKYAFDLTSANGAQLNEIGFDFDKNGIILSNEVIPVRITAYTYGDDGTNPREATGTGGMGFEPWEVYLAGQVELPVVGVPDWNVESEPCLTAGVLPEAQPDGKPLTFMVTDADGNPVDLSKGVGGKTINDIMIWNGLFYDVVPSVLPDYYWVRTDLHNNYSVVDPGTLILHDGLNATAANDMYANAPYDWNGDGIAEVDANGNALEPIKPDFGEKSDGVYKFYGFVANDKGEFEVRVYSPDRKHYAVKKVKVELPKISYEIVNIDDPNGTVHTVPGDPDFVMTAGDLRIYKVTVTVKDCEDKPIGGPGKPVEECKPAEGGLYAGFLPYMGYTPHYFNWIGFDMDGDGDVSFTEWAPFAAYASGYARIYKEEKGQGKVYGPHSWAQYLFYWGNPTYDGFMGQQGIFNSNYDIGPWAIGNMYPDITQDGVIDIRDTFSLDENGQATFFIEADDISALSGIVGKNPYVLKLHTDNYYRLGDVAGWATYLSYPRYRFGALSIGTGYGADWGFFLDWYGNVDKKVDVNFMKFKILNGETHQELGKEIFNEKYYDLTYGLENHIVVQALPADERDIAVREGVQVQLVGNVETWAYGTLMHNADGVAETTLNFLPRGVGSRVAYLGVVTRWGSDTLWQHYNLYPWYMDFTSVGEPLYWTYDDRAPDDVMTSFEGFTSIAGLFYSFNDYNLAVPMGHDIEDQRKLTRLAPPVGSSSWPLPYFDAGKGLAVTLKGDLVVGVETEVVVKVTEAGPNFPVAGAEVTLYGAGVDLSGVTDADGVAKFMVKPTEAGEILITAMKDGYVSGKVVVVVGADTIAPELSVDKPVSPTNKSTVTITGIATDNAGVPMVMVNGVEATVGADGKFSAEVTLKEGENEIVVVAKDKSGNKTEKVVKVVLDTIPPEVTVNALPSPLTSTKVKLSGRVEANAKVMVNDKPATVAYDYWEVELTLDYGENLVKIVASDAVGNEKKIETTVVVFKKTTVELQIGNPTPKVNGVYGDPLEAAPFIKDGRTMVPLRFIAETFGAQVEWIPETKGINISLNLKSAVHTIGLQVGNPTAIVDGQVVTLDVAPVIVNGRTFVPLRFVAEAFGAKVDWNSLYQVVSIEFLWY